jgi:23S rRNA pseudouridine2605 synthase
MRSRSASSADGPARHGDDDAAPRGVRLNKALADAGVAARRKGEDLIRAGRVTVNGSVETNLGTRVEPGLDTVAVDGIDLDLTPSLVYMMLNKPAGYLTAVSDERGRTVMELLPPDLPRVFPIGRLDRDTEGLLLLTNDGEFAHRLMHPRFHVRKTYEAHVDGSMAEEDANLLRLGIDLDDGRTRPAEVEILSDVPPSRVRVTIAEGRKRQVRRMLSAVGHPVLRLERVGYGPLSLGSLPRGSLRDLAQDEVVALKGNA